MKHELRFGHNGLRYNAQEEGEGNMQLLYTLVR